MQPLVIKTVDFVGRHFGSCIFQGGGPDTLLPYVSFESHPFEVSKGSESSGGREQAPALHIDMSHSLNSLKGVI